MHQPSHSIGIFGGTFNPVHSGHIKTALELVQHVPFDEMRLLPCSIPALKQPPVTSIDHRLAMLKIATKSFPALTIDQRELSRKNNSYTLDSMIELRTEHPDSSLSFCMGSDAFNQFFQWYNYARLLDYCHLVICARPQSQELDPKLVQWQTPYTTTNKLKLQESTHGSIYHCMLTPINLSSTQIREGNNDTGLPMIQAYIMQNKLYR